VTGKERVYKALNRKEPDRVPTLEWSISPKVIKAMIGEPDLIRFAKEMELDGVALRIDEAATKVDDRHFIDEWGITRGSYNEYPIPVGFPITTAQDLEKFKAPDPDAGFRFEKLMKAKAALPEHAIIARIRDVFSQPRDLMGFEGFMMAFYLEQDMIKELMEICVNYSTRVAENMKETGIDIICIGDDIANNTGLLIKPEMYRDIVKPYFNKLVANFKKLGYYVIKHSDGDIMSVVDDLIDSGIDCLDPIDPLGGMDIKYIKETYGHRIAIKGNIDCVHTLVDGSAEEVNTAVKRCIREASFGGGHIISSSNTIHSGINPENYRVFFEAVKNWGTYPLDLRDPDEKG
jgi:uroporphyrinogen decarboxylase